MMASACSSRRTKSRILPVLACASSARPTDLRTAGFGPRLTGVSPPSTPSVAQTGAIRSGVDEVQTFPAQDGAGAASGGPRSISARNPQLVPDGETSADAADPTAQEPLPLGAGTGRSASGLPPRQPQRHHPTSGL